MFAAMDGTGDTDGAPSASTWTWHGQYGLFYNPGLGAWARYCAETGSYDYLPSANPTPAAAFTGGDKEEGELSDDERPAAATASGERYDKPRQYAFPSAAEDERDAPTARPATAFRQEFLRLVCLRSSCLPEDQKLATLSSHQPDGYSIGRDRQIGSEEGRIRLREMEVSKTHAIIFYEPPEAAVSAGSAEQDDGGWGSAYLDRDAADPLEATPTKTKPREERRGSWAIVDLGSTHGTFIRSQGADVGKSKSERLSAAKVASLPRTLAHGDVIRIGSSRFEVHLHTSLPCDACSLSSASALIPTSLHPSATKDGSESPSTKAPPALHDPFAGLTSKERLQRLKQDMLKPKLAAAAAPASQRPPKRGLDANGGPAEVDEEPQQPAYVDRAAARRAVHPSYSHASAVAVAAARAFVSSPAQRVTVAPVQDASKPLPASNVGHSLLLKHGWTPGQALGVGADEPGRVEPVEVTRAAGEGKRGLGMKSVAPGPALGGAEAAGEDKTSWRDEGLAKRWAMLN